jgi:hypothetical protein
VTKRLELSTEMMRTNARLHADQARRHIGQPRFVSGAFGALAFHMETAKALPRAAPWP